MLNQVYYEFANANGKISNHSTVFHPLIPGLNVLVFFRLFYATLLIAATCTASAQTQPKSVAPPAPAAITAPAPYSFQASTFNRADTARAIRRLFKNRRGGGIGWLAFGTASILASTLPALQTTSAGVWTPGVVFGSGFLLVGLNKRIQFRAGRERRVLRELAATGHLPHSVSRRLRGKFSPVQGAASDYNPLMAPGIISNNANAAITPAQRLENARADTLRAINRLFERRRNGGKKWAYIGLSGALAMARVLTAPNDGSTVNGGGLALVAGTFIGVPLAASVANLATYREEREEDVDRAYRSGQPLPKKIRQRIKRKDLEPYD